LKECRIEFEGMRKKGERNDEGDGRNEEEL